mmetsp:Transcript_8049/g.18517  ORF Transcript_8049/g.18517 Transcript_8049/m.18517 type:complete len:288 (+) Transcript_8049:562-1425(+)
MPLRAAGDGALGLVHGDKAVKVPATLAKELWRSPHCDLEADQALNIKLPWAALHDLIVQVPQITGQVCHVGAVESVVLTVSNPEHVEGHEWAGPRCRWQQRRFLTRRLQASTAAEHGAIVGWAAVAAHAKVAAGARGAVRLAGFALGVVGDFCHGEVRLPLAAGTAIQRRVVELGAERPLLALDRRVVLAPPEVHVAAACHPRVDAPLLLREAMGTAGRVAVCPIRGVHALCDRLLARKGRIDQRRIAAAERCVVVVGAAVALERRAVFVCRTFFGHGEQLCDGLHS